MAYRYIVAVVRSEAVDGLLRRLRDYGVPGVSLVQVKGFGEYTNHFTTSGLVTNSRLELFIDEIHVDNVLDIIMETCYSGIKGDGVVAVMPVGELHRIRQKTATGDTKSA